MFLMCDATEPEEVIDAMTEIALMSSAWLLVVNPEDDVSMGAPEACKDYPYNTHLDIDDISALSFAPAFQSYEGAAYLPSSVCLIGAADAHFEKDLLNWMVCVALASIEMDLLMPVV